MRGIDGLAAALQALPVRIDDVSVCVSPVAVASYPGGWRPSSVVTLRGDGASGLGEHVGWSDEAHAAFRDRAARVAIGSTSVAQWVSSLCGLPLYDRAALEAAVLDLALCQQRTNLFEVAGIRPRPVRYVVSFDRVADPVALAESIAPGAIELKIDADPAWPDSVLRGLAALGRVAVLDFKLEGSVADHERAVRLLPGAWIEDPKPGPAAWSPDLRARCSADASVTSAAMLDSLSPRPAAVNVKPGRMGSVIDAVACLARCRELDIPTYIGGMFEVGIGRLQLRTLAALACPDGPNDIAPLTGEAARPPRLVADGDAFGFGRGAAA